ncbi:hypothetical protein [Brevibacillus choshinensis]|uniref:Uncharacterized protein n=1 Tax=Brevibacillus choshinensis TaxID=54911 RepID=A0ABX7FKC3_BRECH|nr:hypothetical protein [Brevibacillus choshinensis]QRG66676.1 hypothetical protein JNE38_24715 [Brevibacillus choshinensis]
MVFQSTFVKSTINQSPTNPPYYPEDENRQTYGSSEEATSLEMLPDLIHVGRMNGVAVYVLKKDLDGEQSKSPEEAIEIQNRGHQVVVIFRYMTLMVKT